MFILRALGLGIVGLVKALLYMVFGTAMLAIMLFLATGAHVWGVARADDRQQTDVIFVLGAAQYDGKPSKWFASRLNHAAQLYEEGVAPRIATVGGKLAGDRFTEAEAGRKYLVDSLGVPAKDIVTINTGADTLASVKALTPVAGENGWGSATIVTDPAHTLRSVRMVQDQGIRAFGSPTREGPSVATRKAQASSMLHETGGLLYYQLSERFDRVDTGLPFVPDDLQFE